MDKKVSASFGQGDNHMMLEERQLSGMFYSFIVGVTKLFSWKYADSGPMFRLRVIIPISTLGQISKRYIGWGWRGIGVNLEPSRAKKGKNGHQNTKYSSWFEVYPHFTSKAEPVSQGKKSYVYLR